MQTSQVAIDASFLLKLFVPEDSSDQIEHQYAKKKAVCFGEAREKAWEEIAEEEYGKVHHFQESGGYLRSLKRFRSSIRIKGKPVSTAVLLDREEKR